MQPPPGVLAGKHRDLPPRLRRLESGPFEPGRSVEAGGPKILYPPDGATIAWDGAALPLEATGGRGPLRWLVDGRPLTPAPARRTLYWQPAEPGFTQVTVIDVQGRSARATVRLAP
jgi:penicillin-binding protein 1C